jgi:capsular polysaccharide biosynthesis protein
MVSVESGKTPAEGGPRTRPRFFEVHKLVMRRIQRRSERGPKQGRPDDRKPVFVGARRRWLFAALFIALFTIVCAIIGAGLSFSTPRVYEAETSILVGELGGSRIDDNTILASRSLATAYADLAQREPVLSGAAEKLGLDGSWRQLRNSVRVHIQRENPQVMVISVEARTPREAELTATAIDDQLLKLAAPTSGAGDQTFLDAQLAQLQKSIQNSQQQIDALEKQSVGSATANPEVQRKIDNLQSQISDLRRTYISFQNMPASRNGTGRLRVLDNAHASPAPVRPKTMFNILVAAAAGLALALATAYLLQMRRSRAKEQGLDGRRVASSNGTAPAQARSDAADWALVSPGSRAIRRARRVPVEKEQTDRA